MEEKNNNEKYWNAEKSHGFVQSRTEYYMLFVVTVLLSNDKWRPFFLILQNYIYQPPM